MILSKVQVGASQVILTRFLLVTVCASLSAQARDKGYVQKIWVIAQFVVSRDGHGRCGRELGLIVIDRVMGLLTIQIQI